MCGRGCLWWVSAFLWWLWCDTAVTRPALCESSCQRTKGLEQQTPKGLWMSGLGPSPACSYPGQCPCASRHFSCIWGWGGLEWFRPVPLVQDLSCAKDIIPCHWQQLSAFPVSQSVSLTHLPPFDTPRASPLFQHSSHSLGFCFWVSAWRRWFGLWVSL